MEKVPRGTAEKQGSRPQGPFAPGGTLDDCGRSVAVPGRSNVQTATRVRQSDAGRLCHIAAPGDGRTPAIAGTIQFGKRVLARRRKRQPGRARSPAKSQPCGQWQFGVDERGKGRLNFRPTTSETANLLWRFGLDFC